MLRRVNVRVIAATNRNLAERVASGEFREDLLYRLSVIHLVIPPLRERQGDIPELVAHILRMGGHSVRFSPDAMRAMVQHRWPGNVRELQNVVEQAVWLAPGPTIQIDDLPEWCEPRGAISSPATNGGGNSRTIVRRLSGGNFTFWEHVHPLFLSRDLTRHDIRELVSRGLSATRELSYAAEAVRHDRDDYHRFHNFLAAHGCKVDFRDFRTGTPAARRRSEVMRG